MFRDGARVRLPPRHGHLLARGWISLGRGLLQQLYGLPADRRQDLFHRHRRAHPGRPLRDRLRHVALLFRDPLPLADILSWSDGPTSAQLNVRDIYVQFAGFTAGHTQSFFDFYANATVLGTDPATIGDDTRLNLLAYTHEFSGNLSATLSLEDAAQRQSGIRARDPALFGTGNYQGGLGFPDMVANLKYRDAWGMLQLSGALHQITATAPKSRVDSLGGWGYALQAGVMVNLPALGEDALFLQSAYALGAMSYLGLQNPSGAYGPRMPSSAPSAASAMCGAGTSPPHTCTIGTRNGARPCSAAMQPTSSTALPYRSSMAPPVAPT